MTASLSTRSGFPGLAFAALLVALLPVLGAQASVMGTTPANGSHDVPAADNVSATLSAAAGTPSAGNYIIRGGMSGYRSGVYSGGGTTTPAFDPDKDFFPGEEVEVTLTGNLPLQSGGTLGAPYSWKFRAAAGSASAYFDPTPSERFGRNDDISASVGVGDFNGDGHLDIVVAAHLGTDMVYLNDGSGRFTARKIKDYSQTRAVAVGDLDGDGDLDIVFATGSGYRPRSYVAVNDGSGNFSTLKDVDSGARKSAVAVGDLNGDGHLDIVLVASTDHLAGSIHVYWNDGSGNFSNSSPKKLFGTTQIWALALGDLDGDGRLDIVGGEAGSTVYIQNAAGEFPAGVVVGNTYGTPTMSVALGDMDGDGDLDIVEGNRGAPDHNNNQGHPNALYMNDGVGNFLVPAKVLFDAVMDTTSGIAVGDLNSDGSLDIVATNGWGYKNTIYFNAMLIAGPSDLANARVSQAYGPVNFTVAGGKAPHTWRVAGSGFPSSWATLSSAGAMSGTPPASEADKKYTFDIEVTDATGIKAPKRSYTLYVNDIPKPLPYTDNFENGIFFYDRVSGENARVQNTGKAKKSGNKGLQLDAQPDGTNWPLQVGPSGAVPPGKAGADDPARWATDAASHMGMMEWSVDATGVAAVAVSFDWQAVYSSQNWYTNLVFEVSDDLGATWTIYSGNGANAAGIYRPAGATTDYANTSFTVFGFTPTTELKFRFRWLVKWAAEDAFPTAVFIDNLSLTATTPPAGPFITTNSLPVAVVGAAYDHTIALTGGIGAVTWSATGLPAWLSLNSSTGQLTGTPPAGTTPTTITLTITATDGASNTNTKTLTIAVVDVLTITTGSLANAKEGTAYNVILAAAGGSPGYTWSLADPLPTGISFDDLLGILSGTPAGGSAGSYPLNFTVTDSSNDTASVTLTMTVEPPPPLSITTTMLAQGVALSFYTATLNSTGGVAPYFWSEDAPLPEWLSLDPFSGQLLGRPSIADRGEETLSFTVIDSGTPRQTQSVTLTLRVIVPQPSLGAAGCALTAGRNDFSSFMWAIIGISLIGALRLARRRAGSVINAEGIRKA